MGCVSQHDQHKRQIANILFRNLKPASATLPSSGIQSLLEEADADVLFLYDCCHSAALPTSDTQSQDSGGVKEVLAACGFESIAPGVDKHSFTKALIETLALASRKLTFSIPELHSRVLSRIMGWTPGLMKDEDGKFVKITEGPGRGRLALEREPRTTPIYSMLATTKSRRSIILSPLLPANPQSGTSKNENANSNSSSAASTDPTGLNMPLKKRKRHNRQQAKYPQILVSIRLENDTLDQQAWLDYFRLMPPEAKDIKIEGVYQSFSTLVLLRLPIVVWDLLPDNAAYTFVGFVTSENTVSTISQPEGTVKEQSEVDKKKLDEEVSGDSVSSKKAESQWRMSTEIEARTAKESTTIGRATESPPLRETSTSNNVEVDPSPVVRSPRKAEKEVRGRPLNLPRLLETICDSGLRKIVQTICERHSNIGAEIIASAPRPSPAATIEVLKKYQERFLESFPYGGRPGSDYAYNRVKQPLIQLIDSITDFIPEFLPPNETHGGVSLIILDNATKIICELSEWDSPSHRHHKDNICEEISMAWTLVITEESKKGAESKLLSEGWDIILRKHNERLGGRLQSAVNALERMSLLEISNRSNSTSPKGTNLSSESDPEVEALRNQLQSGSLGN